MTCVAAIAGSMGYSGCLIGRELVPDDVSLIPLVPPAIVEDSSDTDPYPNTLIVLEPQTIDPQSFKVRVVGGSGAPLIGRLFVNRSLPRCTPLVSCGQQPDEQTKQRMNGQPAALLFTFSVPASVFIAASPNRCITVDFFVSSGFQSGTENDHLPVVEGDVAHVRWYVARQDSSLTLPTLEHCLQQ